MKKGAVIVSVILLLIGIFAVVEATKQYPPPWDRIKRYAVESQNQIELGVYVWSTKLYKNGQEVQYFMIYSVEDDSILVAQTGERSMLVGCVGKKQEYKWVVGPDPYMLMEITEKQAIEYAYQFLRILNSIKVI